MKPWLASLLTLVTLGSGPAPAADAVKLTEPEQTILRLTNEARAKEKLPPLKVNAALTGAARGHCATMARLNRMEHVLDGKNPAQRVEAAGYRFRRVGENIAYGENVAVEDVFKGWMESPGHRQNILTPQFEEIGLGTAKAESGLIYYTQVFGTPRSR